MDKYDIQRKIFDALEEYEVALPANVYDANQLKALVLDHLDDLVDNSSDGGYDSGYDDGYDAGKEYALAEARAAIDDIY